MYTWGITIRSACFNGVIALTLLSGAISLDGQRAPSKTDPALDDLHQIGITILDAVLKKDVIGVLRYEPANERAEHEISLKDKTSDIYCFLVDSHSNCARPPGGWPPSVFELISRARQPGIAVNGGNARPDGARYAVLMFYDKSIISERSIGSYRFFCAPANFHKYSSWSFKLVDGKWESVGELFNFETDAPC